MPFSPEPQAATEQCLAGHQQPQSTFAVISSYRCTQPQYNGKAAPSTMSSLTRMKARIRALAAASKILEPKNSSELTKSSTKPHSSSDGITETASFKTRIEDRFAAFGACSDENWEDTENPIPAIPILAKPLNDSPTASSDVNNTLLGRTAARYAAAKAFNLGQPSPDTEELANVCDDIARRAKQPEIGFSSDGTYVPRGVPKERVARFVETGLLEVEPGVDEKSFKRDMGLESSTTLGVEAGPETQSEEEDSLTASKAVLTLQMSTKSVRGRVRGLWKTTRQGTARGLNSRDKLKA